MTPFYAFAWWVTRIIWAVLYDIRVEGRENIPKEGEIGRASCRERV